MAGHRDGPLLAELTGHPAVAIALTIIAYLLALRLQRRWPRMPLFNPTLFAVLLVVCLVEVTGTSYAKYLAGTQVINFMLAPTVVLLAVPLYRRLDLILRSWWIIGAGLAIGLPTGILTAVGAARLCGATAQTTASLAPKSVTTGIAIGISEAIGGVPALSAVFVIATGIVGAAFGPWLLRLLGLRDERAVGIGIGIGSHGIGTARAFQISETMGAFSSVAMTLNGIAQAVLIPLAVKLGVLGWR